MKLQGYYCDDDDVMFPNEDNNPKFNEWVRYEDAEQLEAQLRTDLDRMGKQIEEQRKELNKHRWIPASERLPESCKPYPVSEDVLIVMANEVCLGYYQENHRQWVIYGSYQKPQEYQKAITHWKPIFLPKKA